MCAVQLLRVSVRERIVAAAEDFLRRLEQGEEAAEVPVLRLRALLTERLTAAAEEIVALLEATMEATVADYEGRVERAETELCRQRRLLDALLMPEVRVRRTETPHVKEEREQPGTSQDGEQLGEEEEEEVEEEDHIIQFTFNSEDEESAETFQLQSQTEMYTEMDHTKSESDGDGCGDFGADVLSLPGDDCKTSESTESDVSGDAWIKLSNAHSVLNRMKSTQVPVSDERYHSIKSASCTVCGKTFFSKSILNLHEKIHSGDRPFSCPFCGVGFTRRSTLVEHVRTHTAERPFICSICGKAFSQKSNLKIHMKTHTGEKPYGCASCPERFTWSYQLRNHKCSGEAELPNTGESDADPLWLPDAEKISDAETDDSDDWIEPSDPKPGLNHVKTTITLNIEGKKFVCCECGRAFCSKSGLNRHKRIHMGHKPYRCPWCGTGFGRRGMLVDHMRTHTGERPFVCSVCGKGFNQSAHLKIHTRLHTGEKTFGCVVCRETFTWSYQLKNHDCAGRTDDSRESRSVDVKADEDEESVRVDSFDPITVLDPESEISSPTKRHTGGSNSVKSAQGHGLRSKSTGRSAPCPECGKIFVRKDTLREHMRTHTGEKPFRCSECGKMFNRKTNLTAHMRLHTGEKQFVCRLCFETFTWHHQLKNHSCTLQRPLLPSAHTVTSPLGFLT